MFYEQLMLLCKEKGITVTELVTRLGFSKSNVTYWKKGSVPKSDTLKKIADYFQVSTDYLLTGKDPSSISASNIHNSAVVQGNNATTLIVKNGKTEERELSDHEVELLRIFHSLDMKGQVALLSYAYELEEKNK